MQTHELTCDVLVAGGGPAGVPTALAAARCGASVILCQDRPVLGGNASSEIRMHIVGANGDRPDADLVAESREGGIIEEIRIETAVRNPQRSATMLDLILYEACRAEPNLQLLLNTRVTDAQVADGRITHVRADRPSTEDRFRIAAKVFCDCTGDGGLGVAAGASFREGRESTSEFGESLSVPEADNERLGSTLLFQARKHDRPMPFTPPPWARKFTEHDLRLRPHASAGVDKGPEYGYWWLEWGGKLDTIKDNETIRDELLAILMGVWDHIKNGPPDATDYPNPASHGCENWALEWFGFLPGKRESRRFVGLATLTEQDVMEARPHDDAIAFGGWPIDTHPTSGIDAPDENPCTQHPVPNLYDIPLRTCVSADIENLMFAGRNHSATHIAFASTRVMATCAAVGQGVGTAAARAVARDLPPADLPGNADDVRAIRQRLLRDDAYLIGAANEDPADLARTATATASSWQPAGEPGEVLTGQTRAVHGDRSAPPGRTGGERTHRWMSDPAAGLPAWLELRWPEPVEIAEVQLIFDTGLSRFLTLSQSDGYVEKMIWGRPQPETVKAYRLLAQAGQDWREVAAETANVQRRRVHEFEPVTTSAVRIEVSATNGLDCARLMEVRVYGPDAPTWVDG